MYNIYFYVIMNEMSFTMSLEILYMHDSCAISHTAYLFTFGIISLNFSTLLALLGCVDIHSGNSSKPDMPCSVTSFITDQNAVLSRTS